MQKHNSHTCYSHTRKTAAGDCGTTRVIATVCNELADELPLKWFLHATLVFQDGDPPEPHRSEAATEYSTKNDTFAAARGFHCRMTQTLGNLECYTGIYSEQKNQPDKSRCKEMHC